MRVPADFPVRPLKPGDTAKDRATCGHCGRSWDDGIVTSMTPASSGRCPFEAFHEHPDDDSEVRTITQTVKVHKLPTKTITILDWDVIYARIKAGDERVYEATLTDTRTFANWCKRNHGHYGFYRSVADGLIQFTLRKQRGG